MKIQQTFLCAKKLKHQCLSMKAYLWWDFPTSLNSLSYVCFITTSKFLQTNLALRNSTGGVSPAQQRELQSAGEQSSSFPASSLSDSRLLKFILKILVDNQRWMPMSEILCFLTVIRNNVLDFHLSNISSFGKHWIIQAVLVESLVFGPWAL